MDIIITAIGNFSDFHSLLAIIIGCAIGISIGALPGLTATMGVALILPVTFSMEPIAGILLLIGVYFGAIYGGSIAAILLRTPGTPSSAATAIAGYELTKRGFAYKALTTATLSSSIGGILSVFVLIFIAPQLAKFALNFSAQETFALAVFGLAVITSVAGKSMVKGLIVGAVGLLISTIGTDPMGGFPRFTFGNYNLTGGINFIPVMIGLFAAAQAFQSLEELISKRNVIQKVKKISLKWEEFRTIILTILRSTGIGTFIGMIPGAGGDIGAFVAYNVASTFAKNKDEFNKGNLEGVAAPEAANNGSTGGAMIPLLTLGIPGDAVTAVLLGALMVQGIQPGPQLFQQNGEIVYSLFIGMILANVMIMIYGLLGIRLFAKVLAIPKAILTPVILVLCVVGSYSLGNSMFDVYVMLISGIIGYLMLRYDFSASPVILALILGPMMEASLRRTLVMSNGNIFSFFTRPISAILLTLAIIVLVLPLILKLFKKDKLLNGSDESSKAM
ncbi:tripartite tricarboxylate transporter permease [Halobacillus salinarum]|uniref:Tripartite tricarboxylate transporter permease n=1 Tax=Halobacillus salinarum TaxID=2932257 RepID=A0ABY4EK96_9BACI|nr:tripartite tricarboxylate transporter permease [Halobacillus salinarum]UOQ44283.1 tripartite tricarboxylate transporter permease [Halobacillus salinarum]